MSQIIIKDRIPDNELLVGGHLACPGCGGALAMRLVLKELGPNTIVVLPACCWSIIAGPYPQSSLKVPLYHTAFETGAAVASGVRAALDMAGQKDTNVLVWAGDGGTFDIGLQALSGAAERRENFIYCCYDNEAYMNTGIQRSSATPWGAWTTTTPTQQPQATQKKDILAIMAAHRVSYAATASVSYPVDLIDKVRRAKEGHGTRFLHILAPCPPGWKFEDERSIDMGRLAVQSRVFPLLEVEDGERWRFSMEPERIPVEQYIRAQGRYRHLTDEQVASISASVEHRYNSLKELEQRSTASIS
ncbi:MAG: thiamine pyrophosphate-dependent enzyme [bacterium]